MELIVRKNLLLAFLLVSLFRQDFNRLLTFQLNANEWNYWFDFAVDHGVQVFALEAIKGRILINASNCVDEVLTLSLMK